MDKKCMYCLHVSQFFDGCNLSWECEYEPNFIADRFMEELEAIKAELDKIYQEEIKNDSRWSAGLKYSCKIIDNHIAEMKGETTNSKGVLEQIAEEQKTLLESTKAWSSYIDKNGNIY